MRVAVLASGGGSNFQALVDAQTSGRLGTAEVVVCVTNRSGAGVLDRARAARIPAEIVASTGPAFEPDLLAALNRHDVDFVALAGFLKKIPSGAVRRYPGAMVNIHPALLPAFGGKGMYGGRVHQAVLDYGVKWTGATVHLVDEHYDTGPIVLQEPVSVQTGDTRETLAARVLAVEHQLYPRAIRLFSEGRVRADGRRVIILDPTPST